MLPFFFFLFFPRVRSPSSRYRPYSVRRLLVYDQDSRGMFVLFCFLSFFFGTLFLGPPPLLSEVSLTDPRRLRFRDPQQLVLIHVHSSSSTLHVAPVLPDVPFRSESGFLLEGFVKMRATPPSLLMACLTSRPRYITHLRPRLAGYRSYGLRWQLLFPFSFFFALSKVLHPFHELREGPKAARAWGWS